MKIGLHLAFPLFTCRVQNSEERLDRATMVAVEKMVELEDDNEKEIWRDGWIKELGWTEKRLFESDSESRRWVGSEVGRLRLTLRSIQMFELRDEK